MGGSVSVGSPGVGDGTSAGRAVAVRVAVAVGVGDWGRGLNASIETPMQ